MEIGEVVVQGPLMASEVCRRIYLAKSKPMHATSCPRARGMPERELPRPETVYWDRLTTQAFEISYLCRRQTENCFCETLMPIRPKQHRQWPSMPPKWSNSMNKTFILHKFIEPFAAGP
jgi:hypothetical protein